MQRPWGGRGGVRQLTLHRAVRRESVQNTQERPSATAPGARSPEQCGPSNALQTTTSAGPDAETRRRALGAQLQVPREEAHSVRGGCGKRRASGRS
ncbi:MAG: hypothetical protein ACPIOQ_45830, partial [Promethearchaeia archaeon]